MTKNSAPELNPSLRAVTNYQSIPKEKFDSVHAIVITADTQVVLVREKGQSFFNLPGGRPQLGETSLEAINREIDEELGIILELKYIGYLSVSDAVFFGLYLGFTNSERFQAALEGTDEEIEEYILVSIDELKRLLLEAAPEIALQLISAITKI